MDSPKIHRCPQCGYEYEPWVEICPDCGVLIETVDSGTPHKSGAGRLDPNEDPRAAMMRYLGQFSESTREAQHSEAYVGYDGLSEALTKFDYETFLYPERVVFGDPDQCVERIRALEAMGIRHVGMVVDFGGLEQGKIFASLERFRKYVLPKFS